MFMWLLLSDQASIKRWKGNKRKKRWSEAAASRQHSPPAGMRGLRPTSRGGMSTSYHPALSLRCWPISRHWTFFSGYSPPSAWWVDGHVTGRSGGPNYANASHRAQLWTLSNEQRSSLNDATDLGTTGQVFGRLRPLEDQLYRQCGCPSLRRRALRRWYTCCTHRFRRNLSWDRTPQQ